MISKEERKKKIIEVLMVYGLHDNDIKDLMIHVEHIGKPVPQNPFIVALEQEMAERQEYAGEEEVAQPQQLYVLLSYKLGNLASAVLNHDKKAFEKGLLSIAAMLGSVHKYLNSESVLNWWFQKK